VFPDRRRPAVWWLGIAPSAQLQLLHSRVEQELGPLGFPAETRPFSPHLTLGRTERKAHQGALRGAEARLQDVAYHSTISVETVDLMRSHLASSGARYECVFAIPLRP
jgi:2'-5' RNA ligase